MPWVRPTLTQLRQQARAFFAARLPGADATLRRSNIGITADVLAGMTNGVNGYLDYTIRQNFADTAEDDYLLRQGNMLGVNPTGAIQAAGNITVTGIDGTEVPTNLVLFQDPNENTYTTQETVEIAGGTASVPVIATLGGADQNLPTGASVQVIVAIAGLNAAATVAAPGLTGGADAEDLDTAYRARVLARKRQPPQGGDGFDYIAWAKMQAGVTRAWIFPLNRGGGTCDLTFVMDGRADIIPLVGDISAVQAEIDAEKPVTDDCVVFASIATQVPFTISGLADNPDAQAAIRASLADLFATDAVPAGAYDVDTQTTLSGGLSFQDQIDPAVAAGAGDASFEIVTPNADVACANGHILTLGAITWT